MATDASWGGTVSFLQGCGHREATQVQIDSHTHMLTPAALSGQFRLQKKQHMKWGKEGVSTGRNLREGMSGDLNGGINLKTKKRKEREKGSLPLLGISTHSLKFPF